MILALIIVICVIFGSEAIANAQLVPGTRRGWICVSVFFCTILSGLPHEAIVCVTSDECGFDSSRMGWSSDKWDILKIHYLTSVNLIVLGIVSVSAFFYRRAWCRICPLGALIAIFHRFPPFKWVSVLRLNKVEEKCTKCGICKRVCPTQVTEVYDKKSGNVPTY